MYRNLTNSWNPGTKTLEIHQGELGWYFTIHKDNLLLYQSHEWEDRIKVTQSGMKFLDYFSRRDYSLREQQKGKSCG